VMPVAADSASETCSKPADRAIVQKNAIILLLEPKVEFR